MQGNVMSIPASDAKATSVRLWLERVGARTLYIEPGSQWENSRSNPITSGDHHACGLRTSETAVCWGDNPGGKLSPPKGEEFTHVDSGHDNACGLPGL